MTGIVAGIVTKSQNHTAWQSLDYNSGFMIPGPVLCPLSHWFSLLSMSNYGKIILPAFKGLTI